MDWTKKRSNKSILSHLLRQTESSLFSNFLLFSLLILFLEGSSFCAFSQTTEYSVGSSMENFDGAFGLSPDTDWKVQQTECSTGPNILLPGESAQFTFFIQPKTSFKGKISLEVIRYGTRSREESPKRPVVFQIESEGILTTEAELPPEGDFISFIPPIGETYGGYGLIIELEGRGRNFAATAVRVLPPSQGHQAEPAFALNLGKADSIPPLLLEALNKLGIKGARVETSSPQDKELRSLLELARERELSFHLHLSPPAETEKINDWKLNLQTLFTQYGYPLGPIGAAELIYPTLSETNKNYALHWNRFFQSMIEAATAAEQATGNSILIGISLDRWKNSPLAKENILQMTLPHFINIGDTPFPAEVLPSLDSLKNRAASPHIWNTQTQTAASEDKITALLSALLAMGTDHTEGIYPESLFTPQTIQIQGKRYDILQVWAPAASLAAAQKFIGKRKFSEILFPEGLPWGFIFEGMAAAARSKPNPNDGTLVILGDLKNLFPPELTLFRSVKLKNGASLEIDNPRNEFILYDFYGNPLENIANRLIIPLNGSGYILRAQNKSGSFKRLVKEARAAKILNVEPVEIQVRDLIHPVTSPEVKLNVILKNVLNQPISGSLQALAPGIMVDPDTLEIHLRPHQSKEIEFDILNTISTEREGNNYPLILVWTDENATLKHAETIHVNYISRMTPEIDANPREWPNRFQQIAFLSPQFSTPTNNYRPFYDWPYAPAQGTASAQFAWDEMALYISLKTFGFKPQARFNPNTASLEKYNARIAFNVLPAKEKHISEFSPGTPPGFGSYPDSDYEFALNLCQDGGAEIICLKYPGKNSSPYVLGTPAAIAIRGSYCECAIPWQDIPQVHKLVLQGIPIKMTYRIDSDTRSTELAVGRSVSKGNRLTFIQDSSHWANELLFGIEPPPDH